MERERLDHQDYQQSRLDFIARLAARLYEGGQKVELVHLNHLFQRIAHSLYQHGLVPADLSRRVAAEDENDNRTISQLNVLSYQAGEAIMDAVLDETNSDDWGDWDKFFQSQAEMTDYLGDLAGRFEAKFLEIVDKEEVLNG